MKKNLLFAMMASAIFVGCSNDMNDSGTTTPEDADLVEIKLGAIDIESSVEAQSRALIDNTTGWVGNPKISLIGLAKGQDADWTNSDNVLFNSKNGCITATLTPKDDKEKVNLGGTYYYPFSSEKNFSFYACYPEGTNIIKTANTVTVDYTIDDKGETDILCGNKILDGDGYNAKYFRNNSGAPAPTIQLLHKLTKLDFYVEKGETEDVSDVKDLKVESIVIKNTPKKFRLTLANKNNSSSELAVTQSPSSSDAPIEVFNAPNDDAMITPAASAQIGHSVALCPSDISGKNYYEVYITLVEDGTKVKHEQKLSLYTSNKTKFTEGTQYKVNLKIYGMKLVKITDVTVKKWEDGLGIVEEIN